MVLRRLLVWTVAVVFPLPLVLVYQVQADDPGPLKLYVTLGVTAFAWWLLAILLSVRPRWLDRWVGLPSIYGLHGMLGVLAIVLAYVHRDNSYAGNRTALLLGDWAFYGSLAVLCFSVFFLSGWFVDRVRLLLTAKRILERVFGHQLTVWLHRLNLVIVAMIWLHAHLLDRVNQHFWFMMLVDLYTVAVLGIYAWKKWIAPDTYLTGRVSSVEALTGSMCRIAVTLDAPSAYLRPGDYFFVRFEGTEQVGREWHPFSVTDDGTSTVVFTIRQHGDFTRRLTELALGTRVRLEGPFGRFHAEIGQHDEGAPLVFLGMGAGIAPLLSLTAAHAGARSIQVLWAVRNPEDAYYRELLDQYRTGNEGRVSVHIQVGRFRREHLVRVLAATTLKRGAFFIVGPNPAVLSTQRLLRRLGVPGGSIHHERLTM